MERKKASGRPNDPKDARTGEQAGANRSGASSGENPDPLEAFPDAADLPPEPAETAPRTSGGHTGNHGHHPSEPEGQRLAELSIAALGVVFGDIATSPLYAIRECFHGEYAIEVSRANVLGVLSLIFWSLLLIVTVKYLTVILRADNQGEGGVLALTALVRPATRVIRGSARWMLIGAGLFASCLLYGDGMITPAISVLSAVEGLRIVTPVFQPVVVPATIVILAGIFLIQKGGTARVGRLFGPVILLWLATLAVLGIRSILDAPEILAALSPRHAIGFFLDNGSLGFLVLGAVFLVVTGAEALYADIGHFGKRPIRITWTVLVLPALLCNYFGQGALLLLRPEETAHPFYSLVPAWAMVPMVGLATLATIIASQAVITGSFSLTRQAIQMGYLPRMRVIHTSAAQIGQIYVSSVNWFLMVCTIGLVLGFESSSKLAAAYGVAVTTTMLITSMLFYVLARERWGWNRFAAGGLVAAFLVVDLSFFGANMTKILHGAWFPLVIAFAVFFLMMTWAKGRSILKRQLAGLTPPFEEFKKHIEEDPPHKVGGQAIFLTGNPDNLPAAFIHNLRHNRIVHSEVVFLHLRSENMPRVPNFEKAEVRKLGGGFFSVIFRHGFMEEPKIDNILALANKHGLEFKMENLSFFLGREKLALSEKPKMGRFRSALFMFMSRNAMDAASFFGIPPDQIIEVGVRLEL